MVYAWTAIKNSSITVCLTDEGEKNGDAAASYALPSCDRSFALSTRQSGNPEIAAMSKSSSNALLVAVKIAGQLCVERITRPKARRLGDVPYSVSAITPEWLTAILCKNHPGARVTGVEIEFSSSGTHTRHRLTLTYNDEGVKAGLPKTL